MTKHANPNGRWLRSWMVSSVALLMLWTTSQVTAVGDDHQDAKVEEIPGVFLDKAPKNVADLKLMEQQVQKVMDKVAQCTVSFSGGSGVVISKDGYILSVAHVTQRAGRTVTITFQDGRRVKGKTLGANSGIDAGLVKITDEGEWPHVEMGKSSELIEGQWCLAVGYPVSFSQGKAPPVRIGRVIRNSSRTVVTDCTIMGGDSGGPLFDMQGRVIGISSRVSGSLRGNVHVPVDSFRNTWDRLVAGEVWNDRRRTRSRSVLGMSGRRRADDARVSRVETDSVAEQAGIRQGDVIVKVDGQEIKQFNEIKPIVDKKKPGDAVEFVVKRGKMMITLTAVLPEPE